MSSSRDRVLQPLSNLPPTPGRQVKHLKSELEKKETENDALKKSVSDLTKALGSLQLVQEKATTSGDFFNKVIDADANKKRGKKRDPDAPAPAVTAYRYFCEDVKYFCEEEKSTENMRQMWKECKGEARKKYTDMALADKERFEKENEVYQKKVSEKEAEEKALEMYYEKQKQDLAMEFYEAHIKAQNIVNEKKKKKEKDPDAPKGAMSSYMFFCQEKREAITNQNPDKSPTEITKILGEEWGKLTKGKSGKKGTKKYDDMATADRLRYENEKEAYDALKAAHCSKIEEEREMQLQKDKEEAVKLMEKIRNENASKAQADPAEMETASKSKKDIKPKGPKRAVSAYNFFIAEKRSQIKAGMAETATNQEIMVEVGRQWRSLDDEKKKPYVDMASKDKERYEKEMKTSK